VGSKKNSSVMPYSVGSCPKCGKQCFTSRKAARAHWRKRLPQEQMSVYQCGQYFHYGHMPYSVQRGLTPRNKEIS